MNGVAESRTACTSTQGLRPLSAQTLRDGERPCFVRRNIGCSCAVVRPLALCLVLIVGCSVDRSTPSGSGGAHPVGWADKASPAFHAAWLKGNKFPLSRCQQCHGDDFAGGAVQVSCSGNNCHAEKPTSCTTCHHSNTTPPTPRPDEGAHALHQAYCSTCHEIPAETVADVERHASGDATTLLRFSGIAVNANANAKPAWDPASKRCTNTYCHGTTSPAWTDLTKLSCSNGCHQAPPASHARWARVASTIESCASCHPSPTDPRHVNGVVDVTVTSCTACHGSNGSSSPPAALDGSQDPTSRGVGAHDRHLNGALPDRIGKPLACGTCHVVPASVLAPGHLDQAQTGVRFPFGGSYDQANQTCTVDCHFDRTPGPKWTDASGAARQCNACHEFPPKKTRAGTPHPSVAGDLAVCRTCHVFDPATHVNGVVDFVTP